MTNRYTFDIPSAKYLLKSELNPMDDHVDRYSSYAMTPVDVSELRMREVIYIHLM